MAVLRLTGRQCITRQSAAAANQSPRTHQPVSALRGADVLYVKEWGATSCYGDAAADARLRSALTGWCVRNDWFARTEPECRVLHCLPVRRNTAIADEVLDGPRSAVQREAANRLNVQIAVLHELLKS